MLSFNNFFLNESSKKLIKKWIKEDYKKNPLCIWGKTGVGKTSLANVILKDFKIIITDENIILIDPN